MSEKGIGKNGNTCTFRVVTTVRLTMLISFAVQLTIYLSEQLILV